MLRRKEKITQHPLSLFGKTLGDVQPGLSPPRLSREQGQECGQLWQRVLGALEFFCFCASRPREQSRCICARKTACCGNRSLFLGSVSVSLLDSEVLVIMQKHTFYYYPLIFFRGKCSIQLLYLWYKQCGKRSTYSHAPCCSEKLALKARISKQLPWGHPTCLGAWSLSWSSCTVLALHTLHHKAGIHSDWASPNTSQENQKYQASSETRHSFIKEEREAGWKNTFYQGLKIYNFILK